ncbi:MAG: 2-oxo acid dehydrogenase subunit E2 [Wolbachia endosymbiont of Fragariocoptes setiger]|nr:2-oxo acid dehydrogenase subunit E2 [Wolbachia endosymbiont of Fragariocoptes setiger]
MPIEILMPALSPTMSKTGGKIVKWHKKEQEKVEVGDVIAEIETDKAIMEFESVDEGIIAKILIPEGTSGVSVNQPIAIMLEEGEDLSTDCEIKEPNVMMHSDSSKITKSNVSEDSRIKISPVARRIAENEGININELKGTGPYGRIVKADVLNNITDSKVHTNATEVAVSNMRQIIAQRLVESKQTIPHFYLTIDCKIDKLILLKNEINSAVENSKVTINDLVIKAVAMSMKKFPDINSSWIDNKILKYSSVDVSVAVALDDGLITPIIKNADDKSILSISKEIKELASRARLGKLKPEEFQGGGLTVSNLGMFGIKAFSAIINPPQSCIIAIGASEKRPIVINEKIEILEMMTVTLSVDHRAVDGALSAKFLNTFRLYMENPLLMIV